MGVLTAYALQAIIRPSETTLLRFLLRLADNFCSAEKRKSMGTVNGLCIEIDVQFRPIEMTWMRQLHVEQDANGRLAEPRELLE